MTDKTEWEVKQLTKNDSKQDDRLKDLEKFQHTTVEQLKTIFTRLKEIEKSNKWVSQTFFYLLVGGVFSAISSLIVWLIQR